MHFALSAKAIQDLKDIYLYSHANWGETKATNYLETIEKTIENLVDHPKIGKPQIRSKQIYYTFPCQSHIIYYQLHTDVLYVITILHHTRIPILPKNKKAKK